MLCILAVFFAGMVFAEGTQEGAETYPRKNIDLIIPQAAGGGFDLSARAYVSVAPEYYGKPVVIRIRAGGGTVIGTRDVVEAAPDGHTLLYGGNHLLASKYLAGDIPFDPLTALKPVCRLVNWPWVLVVRPDSPWETFEEFMDYARENPGKIKMANAGALTVAQVPALEVEQFGNVKFTHVPYDGGGPANQSVVQGDADSVFAVTAWAVSAVQDGLVRGLAVTGQERHPYLPDIPTLREFDIPSDTTLWAGIYAPKDTPDEIVNKIDGFTQEIIENTTYQKMMTNLGNIIRYLGPEEFAESIEEADESFKNIAETLE